MDAVKAPLNGAFAEDYSSFGSIIQNENARF